MSTSRRAALALPLAALAVPGRAQSWPTRPIRLIIGFPAGGGMDRVGRAVAEALRPHLPQPLVVENRAGANGAIAAEAVARAAADGHTLLIASSTHNINRHQLTLTYDPLRDFAPVAILTRQVLGLATGTASPFTDLAGFLAAARAAQQPITIGVIEALTSFAAHDLARRAGVRLEEEMYRNNVVRMMTALMAGHPPVGFIYIAGALPLLRSGHLRVLAVTGAERSPALPDVPTVAESGFDGYEVAGWVALLGPAALPAVVMARLYAALGVAFTDPALRARLDALGLEADLRGPEDARAFMAADAARWDAAAAAGLVGRTE
jgi:tripartite-type tricarboxylate transporter receptor subunit TctC